MGLRGELNHFSAIEVLQLLAGQKKTGVLRLYQNRKRIGLVFFEGDIISTWDRTITIADPFKEYLLRRKLLPEHQMMKALRLESRTDLPLSEILLRERILDLTALSDMIMNQILEKIREVLGWTQGQFEFFPTTAERKHIPGCQVKVEALLLEAARQYDERPLDNGNEAERDRPIPVPSLSLSRAARRAISHAALFCVIPVAAWFLSGFLYSNPDIGGEEPLLGERIAEFSMEREVRNLRLLLEMYKALNDRYPDSLAEMTRAGLLSPRQLQNLQSRQLSYRSIRGGRRYFLQSGRYGSLVRALPESIPLPSSAVPEPILYGSPDGDSLSSITEKE